MSCWPCHRVSGTPEWINKIPTVPAKGTGLAESAGKKDPVELDQMVYSTSYVMPDLLRACVVPSTWHV